MKQNRFLGGMRLREVSNGGFPAPLFPSKIALCSHVPKCFPYLFNKFALIPCFHPVICKVLSPCFLKIGSCSLVSFNILLCSFVPPNPWETSLRYTTVSEVIYEMFHILNCGFWNRSNPLKSWLFQASTRNCLNYVHNCDDHSSFDYGEWNAYFRNDF